MDRSGFEQRHNQLDPETVTSSSNETAGSAEPKASIIIKKYTNRRLYNTATSSYVTLDSLCQMVKDGVEFEVFDAKTNENITRSVLTQIIVEEEAKGENLLPTSFLRQIISLYGDGMDGAVHSYLDNSMQLFTRNQDALRDMMSGKAVTSTEPGAETPIEAITKQNIAFFENTMKLFNPMAASMPAMQASAAPASAEASTAKSSPKASAPAPDEAPKASSDLSDLKAQMDAIQAQLSKLSGN